MLTLCLKFGDQVLKEVPLGANPVVIGRSPANDIFIDNLAVSTQHARVFIEEGQVMIEDLKSMNGTLVNGQRIERASLKEGDTVQIGKHTLALRESFGAAAAAAPARAAPKAVPKLDETMVMVSKRRKEAPGEPEAAASPRVRVPRLVVLSGKTDQKEYPLTSKLTVIGKSEMASVRLKGWFAPKVAAQINKHEDGYYIGRGDKIPKVNGQPVEKTTKLNDGDLIEAGGVKLTFNYGD